MSVETSVGTDRWVRRAGVFHRDRGDRVVALRPDDDDAVILDATAAAMWRRLNQGRTLGELAASLADHFGVPAEDIEADVEAGLLALHEAGLVTRR